MELVHLRQDNACAALPAEAVGVAGEQPQAAQQGPLQRARKGTGYRLSLLLSAVHMDVIERDCRILSLAKKKDGIALS